ncbi:TetR/AcrR family transcriptional regulator [Actinocorallia longicatena]|uniref:TetR/AcrR family transcriptional regulator n=1 Tax=Actinocorallia longicatena TaxID=111803 RepID=A0ABP6PXF9_9ACTN
MTTPSVQESWSDLPATAQKLLLAALEAFGEQGFHGTSTRQVAMRAGMSPAAMYMHFPTKEALLYEIARTGHEVVAELCDRADEGSPAERVAAIVQAMVRFHAEHHTLARIIQYEHSSLTPEHQRDLLALRRRTDGRLRSAIDAGVATGEFTADPMTSTALLSLTIDVARWFPTQTRRTPAEIAGAYTDLALRMLRT